MKSQSFFLAVLGVAGLSAVILTSLGNRSANAAEAPSAKSSTPPKIVKTESEWKKILSPEAYRITRQAGTERPYGAAYEKFKKQGEGTYYCVACNEELFASKQKFDSACGWPSFYDPSKPHNVKEKIDLSGGRERIEVVCTSCDGHLGHVFKGEGFNTPTNKRYCINAAALTFVEAGGEAPPKLSPMEPAPSETPKKVATSNK